MARNYQKIIEEIVILEHHQTKMQSDSGDGANALVSVTAEMTKQIDTLCVELESHIDSRECKLRDILRCYRITSDLKNKAK